MSIVAPVIASSLMLISWRFPFLLFLTVIPNLIWIWFIVPGEPRRTSVPLLHYFRAMFKAIRNPLMLAVNLTVLIRFLAYFGYLTYISFLGKESLGMTTMAVGIVIAVKSVLSLIGSTQTGRLSHAMHTAMVETVAFLMTAGGLLIIGVWPSVFSLVAGSVLYGLGDGILNAVQKSLINTLSARDVRGGAIAISTGIGNLGKALAPSVMAVVLALFDIAAIFTVSGMLALLAALVSFGVWRGMAD
jgi:predicted MFS family arabinose efflux permease